MAMGRAAPELARLLNKIADDAGSYNIAADQAGVSRGSYSRAARGEGGLSRVTAERLEDAYGKRYGFTARQLREWSLGAEPEEEGARPDPVPAARRVFWSRVQDEFTPEERAKAEGMIDLAEKLAADYIARDRESRVPRKRYEPPADLG